MLSLWKRTLATRVKEAGRLLGSLDIDKSYQNDTLSNPYLSLVPHDYQKEKERVDYSTTDCQLYKHIEALRKTKLNKS